MSRISLLQNVDPILTSVSRGFTNNAFVSELVLPVVPVDKEVGRVMEWGKENFRVYNTERELRADSNVGEARGRATQPYQLVEHDFEIPVDYREVDADDTKTLEADTAEETMEVLKLGAEKSAADTLQATATYPSGSYETLGAGDAFNDPTSHPIITLKDAAATVRSKIGKRANTLLLAADSFEALKEHPDFIERIKYSQTGVLTIELLKQILGYDNIYVGEGVYSTNDVDFTDLWKDSAIVMWVNPTSTPGTRKPSFGWTLQKKGSPATDKYTTNGGKINKVRSTLIYQQKIVGANAGYLIKNTIQ